MAGDSKPPAWLLNLQANTDVKDQLNRDRTPATAEVLEKDHPDYDRLWQALNEHQSITDQPIPLVRLVNTP